VVAHHEHVEVFVEGVAGVRAGVDERVSGLEAVRAAADWNDRLRDDVVPAALQQLRTTEEDVDALVAALEEKPVAVEPEALLRALTATSASSSNSASKR
jgi:hypothetical protein